MGAIPSDVIVGDASSAGRPSARGTGAAPARRVALVTEYYYPHLGGVCEHVHFLARELRRRGQVVDIVTSSIDGAASAPGIVRVGRSVPVYANGSMARITVARHLRRRVRALLRDGGYDVVHVHAPLSPTLPLVAVEEAEVPVVGTLHTYFPRSVAYRLLRARFQRVLDRLDAVICVSPTAAAAHARYFDATWTIVPNGVDLELFRRDAPRPPELDPAVQHVLFLGRLDPRNGLSTLIAAFRQARARRGADAWRTRLVVVGDGPLRRWYEARVGDDPDVRFVGARRDDRPGFYAHADVYACPTTKASFGITLVEAMACGTPIVCSDIVGFRDVVRDGREALLVPRGDADALGAALARLLDDAALRRRLGAAGHRGAARYAWPAITDRIVAIYDRVTRRDEPAAPLPRPVSSV